MLGVQLILMHILLVQRFEVNELNEDLYGHSF